MNQHLTRKRKVVQNLDPYYNKRSVRKSIGKSKAIYHKCSICLEINLNTKCNNQDNNIKYLPCCHFFHEKCINTWLDKNLTCPECRIPIFIQDSEQLNSYNSYLSARRLNPNIIRQNIPVNDNATSLSFMRDNSLFFLDNIEDADLLKFGKLIEQPNPAFTEETYAHLFDSESEYESESEYNYNQEQYDQSIGEASSSLDTQQRPPNTQQRPPNTQQINNRRIRQISSTSIILLVFNELHQQEIDQVNEP